MEGNLMKTSYLKRYIRFRTNLEGRYFIWSIIIELISRFPISLKEAIDLINQNWRHIELTNHDDMAYHESPEFWAKDFYWGHNSIWWKKGGNRIQMGLEPLKPERKNKFENYYVCTINTGEIINNYSVLLSYSNVKALKLIGLIDKDKGLIYSFSAKNYNEALMKHYRKSGWGTYREEG